MFAASAALFFLSLSSLVVAKPLSFRRGLAPNFALQVRGNDSQPNGNVSAPPPPNGNASAPPQPNGNGPAPPQPNGNAPEAVSFNNWNNIPALQGFDDFNGRNNFDGRRNDQVIEIKETQIRCEVVQIERVQQKLAILQELAKRIITEQICDVETQTIVLSQHRGALKVLQDDIHRKRVDRQVGYDEVIAKKINSIISSDGSLNKDDLGFHGSDIGKNTVVPTGVQWDDSKSPALVDAAHAAAKAAEKASDSQ